MIRKNLNAVNPGGEPPANPAPPKVEPAPKQPGANPPAGSSDAAALTSALVEAGPQQQAALLQQMRDSPGPTFTEALAAAIPRLRGDAKTRARQALAQRFERMDAEGLRLQLRSPEAEIRRAGAAAAGAKKGRVLVPDLIPLLEDRDATVLQAARGALRQVSGQDFGPELDVGPAERAAAVSAWRNWWKQQGGK
jgi:hypothetical protein